jgi:hypothetical protein
MLSEKNFFGYGFCDDGKFPARMRGWVSASGATGWPVHVRSSLFANNEEKLPRAAAGAHRAGKKPANFGIMRRMTTVALRREIKKVVDRLPAKHLGSVADYVHFLIRPSTAQRIAAADKAIALGKGVNWRKVRSDV